MYYKLILCCVHTLTDKSGIVLHKSDDAVVVLGIGIAYPSALYHFQPSMVADRMREFALL